MNNNHFNNVDTARSFPNYIQKNSDDKNIKNSFEFENVKVSKKDNILINNKNNENNEKIENNNENINSNIKKKVRIDGQNGGNCCVNFNKVCITF